MCASTIEAEANEGLARATTQKKIYKAVEFPKRTL